jgi:hypothetical protein
MLLVVLLPVAAAAGGMVSMCRQALAAAAAASCSWTHAAGTHAASCAGPAAGNGNPCEAAVHM